jgi:hypothetical protein
MCPFGGGFFATLVDLPMQQLIKASIVVFLTIFTLTAVLTLVGVGYVWFSEKQNVDLPYLRWLISVLIVEVVGVIITLARRGFRYLPEVRINRNASQTSIFMKEFIAHGSSVTIVSNRLGWLTDAPAVQAEMIRRAHAGAQFEIITSQPVAAAQRTPLAEAGVLFFETGPELVPEARFTLINSNRSGAERLAIAKGTHPNHEITIFDSTSGPQIIGLAKDIIRKSKALIDAASME